MKDPDSDDRDRSPQADDVIVVSAEDCANAYLEFSSETTLPSPASRAERRECDSEFLSEDDPDFLDRVNAQIVAEDDWGLTSEGDAAGDVTALVITAASSSVTRGGFGSSAPQPMSGTSKIIFAVATVAAFATGALAVRIVLGPPNARAVTQVAPELPTAPHPPAFVSAAQAEPVVPGAPGSPTYDRQEGAEGRQSTTPSVAVALANGAGSTTRPVTAAAVTRASRLSSENERSAISPAGPTPVVTSANLMTGSPLGGSALTGPINPPAPAPLETIAVPLPASSLLAATPIVPAARTPGGVDRVLARYQAAFSDLDVDAVHQIWPTADRKALTKAFEQLQEERLTFESCDVTMSGNTAAAVCSGTTRYVPRVGNKSVRVERQQWHLSLREAANAWVVDSVDIRPRR